MIYSSINRSHSLTHTRQIGSRCYVELPETATAARSIWFFFCFVYKLSNGFTSVHTPHYRTTLYSIQHTHSRSSCSSFHISFFMNIKPPPCMKSKSNGLDTRHDTTITTWNIELIDSYTERANTPKRKANKRVLGLGSLFGLQSKIEEDDDDDDDVDDDCFMIYLWPNDVRM